jgi:hypothetical protein
MAPIAPPRCDCPDCRAAHWDVPVPHTFTAHEVTDAWQDGHDTGEQSVVRRLIDTLTTWLTTDETDPVKDND